jgi:hypothetical protein
MAALAAEQARLQEQYGPEISWAVLEGMEYARWVRVCASSVGDYRGVHRQISMRGAAAATAEVGVDNSICMHAQGVHQGGAEADAGGGRGVQEGGEGFPGAVRAGSVRVAAASKLQLQAACFTAHRCFWLAKAALAI